MFCNSNKFENNSYSEIVDHLTLLGLGRNIQIKSVLYILTATAFNRTYVYKMAIASVLPETVVNVLHNSI